MLPGSPVLAFSVLPSLRQVILQSNKIYVANAKKSLTVGFS
jgi:hypothetical protein